MAEIKGVEVKRDKVPAGLATQDKPEPVVDDTAADESYVWLADGSVLRVANADVPQGGHLTLGHWQRGDKVFQVVAVYPVEDKGMAPTKGKKDEDNG